MATPRDVRKVRESCYEYSAYQSRAFRGRHYCETEAKKGWSPRRFMLQKWCRWWTESQHAWYVEVILEASRTDSLARRKLPRSQPSPRIDVKRISHAYAVMMNFFLCWFGPSCGNAIKQTKTVRRSLCSLLDVLGMWSTVVDRRCRAFAGGKQSNDLEVDHRVDALGIAQGLCSVAVPSLKDSQQTKIIAVVVVMTFTSTLAVVLRFIARYLSSAKYGYDDLFIIIALVSLCPATDEMS